MSAKDGVPNALSRWCAARQLAVPLVVVGQKCGYGLGYSAAVLRVADDFGLQWALHRSQSIGWVGRDEAKKLSIRCPSLTSNLHVGGQ